MGSGGDGRGANWFESEPVLALLVELDHIKLGLYRKMDSVDVKIVVSRYTHQPKKFHRIIREQTSSITAATALGIEFTGPSLMSATNEEQTNGEKEYSDH